LHIWKDCEQSHEVLYEEFLQLCTMADEGGMRTIWTGEHHAMEFTIAPNPFLTITDLARHTRNVRLGTGTVVAPFWHPIKLAGEAAMTDLMTKGRLELGIARGAYSFEYERLMPGLDPWEAGQRMREIAPLLPRLWQGDCEHEGEFFQFPSTTSSPKPIQKDGPPIWIAARDINSHIFGVQNGFNIQCTPLWNGIKEITDLMGKFNEACDVYDGKHPKIMLLHHCYVAKDSDQLEAATQTLSTYFNYFGAWFQNNRPVSQALIEPLTPDEIAANKMMSPENLRRDLTIGTAQDVIDKIKRYEDLGYDEFSYWIDSGMSAQRKQEGLDRFLNEVMPAFS